MQAIIIIGTGLAGYTVAREFRKLDQNTPLLLITGDDGSFYSKPMLSNALAQGKSAAQLVTQSAEKMAAQVNASILTNTRVEQIDARQRTVTTATGSYSYSKLVIATGARPIRLDIAGNAAGEVLSVNNITDYAALRAMMDKLQRPARIVILGAGLIGCEFADDLATAGHQVSLVDPNALPLSALAPAAMSQGLQAALGTRQIQMKLGTTAVSVNKQGQDLSVELGNGETLMCDIVLSAVGLRPDLELAYAAQLAVERGILVDAMGRTSAEDVYALGDCAQYSLGKDGSSRTLPYIAPLMSAARSIAKNLNGQAEEIDLRASPVIVKTPSYPLALVAPSPGEAGRWERENNENNTICRFFDTKGRLSGFAVAPQDARLRLSLMAELNA